MGKLIKQRTTKPLGFLISEWADTLETALNLTHGDSVLGFEMLTKKRAKATSKHTHQNSRLLKCSLVANFGYIEEADSIM